MNVPNSTISTILRKLDFDDLHDWAGAKIVNRGKNYVKHVDQLSHTEDNTLVAWVTGNDRYATSVRIGADGDFDEFCTCPYSWGPCKHAVAVILAAAEHLKVKRMIPSLDEGSDLGQTLRGDIEENEWLNGEREENNESGRTPSRTEAQTKLEETLESKSYDELLHLLIELSTRFPKVKQYIVESEQLASGHVDKLVRALRSEIRDRTAEAAWYNHWRGEGSLPDYSHVEDRLRALAEQGYVNAVLQLGEELWIKGNQQIEQSDDEGETAMAISGCLETVIAALPGSSLSPSEQLLW
ncbi:SWIM zinc finger family protein [Nitrococcus mobilis]|uniref:SWIM-type domain-containing protein n=1 Tax=Nitrococcus mobilis Nb-231 TaxID=314278 RepID=A4BU68_9GAMM|nr:SWIM zinc finger family protein [Nitrococcus mobilis]EAR20742.1 hypothetical protein NB231_12666 [Nitrococcus mobilis Nb-231]